MPEDPFSDGPFQYLKTDTGVVIYSLGEDGQDDGGLSQREVREQAEAAGDRWPEGGWDLPFRLLNVGLRGAERLTFRDEVMKSEIDLETLEACGFSRERLREFGFDARDIEDLAIRAGPSGR